MFLFIRTVTRAPCSIHWSSQHGQFMYMWYLCISEYLCADMYVCIYVYIYISVYIHIDIYIHIYIYTRVYTYFYVHSAYHTYTVTAIGAYHAPVGLDGVFAQARCALLYHHRGVVSLLLWHGALRVLWEESLRWWSGSWNIKGRLNMGIYVNRQNPVSYTNK